MYLSTTSILTKGRRLVRYSHIVYDARIQSKCLQVFSSSVIGASLEEENEDTQPPADNVSASASDQNFYEVIGTLNDKASEKPSWVTEIIPVSVYGDPTF